MECIYRCYDHSNGSIFGDVSQYYERGGLPFYQNNVAFITVKATPMDGGFLVHFAVSTEVGEVVALSTRFLDGATHAEAQFEALEEAIAVAERYDPRVTCFFGADLAKDVAEKLKRKVQRGEAIKDD
ncbi:hypothetical protein J26TS2_01130 [Shouchella clausii]|nr:hypothetical protein J26TS2_01130 [Shouchella clausii]